MATSISPIESFDTPDAPPAPPIAENDAGRTKDELESVETPETNGFSGVHDVFRTVDHWFDRETHQIEREADRFAEQWSNENLPTLTGVGEETLPPEEVLARLCGELWQRWPERVQVKMQDAIDSSATDLAKALGSARAALVEMKVARSELRETEQKVEGIRKDMADKKGKVKYDAFFPTWLVWTLTTMLIVVEFIANQPVFRIIWPMQSDVAAALSEQVERAANSGLLSGMKIAAIEALSFFEATMLALAVVVLLFVLAKALGTSVRPIVALKKEDHPFASRSIESLHRQKRVLGGVAAFGALAVLIFLFMSRASATKIVDKRVFEARERVAKLRQSVDSVERAGGIVGSSTTITIARAQDDVMRLEDQLMFAKTVESNNGAILILNLSLVCFAFVVGFMGDKRDLTDAEGEHPDFQRLREKCTRLNEQIVRYGNEAREHVTAGQMAIGRLDSLQRSRPLATLEAKRERLTSVIPRWRTTNARLRGLDPVSIAAFRRPVVLGLPEISQQIRLVRPDTVAGYAEELKNLIPAIYSAERETERQLSDVAEGAAA